MTARLVLIGASGSGKSVIAGLLAQVWGVPVIDTDQRYQAQFGEPVSDAVIHDEALFRRREQQIALDALRTDGAVVAVGSGAPASADVLTALAEVPVAWLQVGLVDAARRTGLSGARPLALGNVRAQLHQMLAARDEIYASVADVRIVTDGREAQSVADEIVEWEAGYGSR